VPYARIRTQPHTKDVQYIKKLIVNRGKSQLHKPYRHPALNHTIPFINKLIISSKKKINVHMQMLLPTLHPHQLRPKA